MHSAPRDPADDDDNLTPEATHDGFGSVKITWDPPASLSPPGTGGPTTVSGYMIDVSEDGVNWRGLQRSTGRTSNQYLYVDTEVKPRHYRIFAWNGGVLGPASTTGTSDVPAGATIVAPGPVRNLDVAANGPTQIDLDWDPPSNLGNAPIIRYNIHARMQGTANTYPTWPAPDAAVATNAIEALGTTMVLRTKDGVTTTHSHTDLEAGQTWQYRVLAVNETPPANAGASPTPNVSDDGFVYKTATTTQESMPEKPEGLTAEDAKDSSNDDAAARGVLLQWNAPNPPDGATLGGYRVDRKVNDGAWTTLSEDTGSLFTDYTDEEEPEATDLRAYRVAAISENDVMCVVRHGLLPARPVDARGVRAQFPN